MNGGKKMRNSCVMVDIETLDTAQSAVILSIGACHFDLYSDKIRDTLLKTISLESSMKEGRTVAAGTILWWLQQSKEAQNAFLAREQLNLGNALRLFGAWCSNLSPRPKQIWAKDPDFDCAILQHAFAEQKILWPFKFWESRSVRTIVDLAYSDDIPSFITGTKHSAEDDAIGQAKLVQAAHKILKPKY